MLNHLYFHRTRIPATMFGYIKGIISWTSTTPSPSELVEAEKQQLIRETAMHDHVREQVRMQLEEQLQYRAVQQRRDHLSLVQQRPEQLPRLHRAKASLVGGSSSGTLPKTPTEAPPPRSLAMLFPSFDNDPPIAGSSSLTNNPAFADNPFVTGNRKYHMSTEEREKYIMATDKKHESNCAFYKFPDDSSTPEPSTRSCTPVASPARIEVQQPLSWVDLAALIIIRRPLRQYVKCSPLSVVRCTSSVSGRCVEDFRISGSE